MRRLLKIWRAKPFIRLSRYGQATLAPMVSVCLHSRDGMCGMYSYPDDEIGNAKAELYSKTLAHISKLPVKDDRHV